MMKKITTLLFVSVLLVLAFPASAQMDTLFMETFPDSIPSNWTVSTPQGDGSPSADWVWTNTGPAGQFSLGALASATANNGWMIFDSDLNCSGAQESWLISPQLDFTGQDVVVLEFGTRYAKFDDLVTLQVSTDSSTWEEINLFPTLGNNDFTDGSTTNDAVPGPVNPDLIRVNLTTQAANASTFWFAFKFLSDATTDAGAMAPGCGYSWQIDDVNVLNFDPTPPPPSTDIAISSIFFSPASFAQPITQIDTDTIIFFADVSNNGTADLTNVWLRAEVIKEGNEVIFSDSVMINILPAGAIDSTLNIDGIFVANDPDVHEIGTYTIEYTTWSADAASDATPADNTSARNFLITENLFSKEDGPTIAFRPGDGGPHIDMNVYRTSDNMIDGEYSAAIAQFCGANNAADGPIAGTAVNLILSEVDDELVAPNWDGFDTDAEPITNPTMILKSFTPYTYAGNNFDIQTMDIIDFNTETPGVPLKPGTRYIIGLQYDGDNAATFHCYSEDITYPDFISNWLYTDQWFGGYQDDPSPTLRMGIELTTTIDETPLPEGAMEIFPNPVSDVLNMNVALEQSGIANITIADMSGKVIQLHDYSDLREDNFQFNVSNLAAGAYLVRLATESGTTTKKFIIQR